jgi:glutamate-1-semialdehyde 2,1-aminomutase
MKNLCSFYPESIGNPHPQAILEDLIDFFPAKIFDVHAHVYRRSIDSVPESIFLAGCPENTGIAIWQSCMKSVFGKNSQGGLFMPYPVSDIEEANEFLIKELNDNPDSRGLLLVPMTEEMPEYIEKYLDHPCIRGFKPYYFYGNHEPKDQGSINSFVPEWVWEEANRKNFVVTLHIVKDKALADDENLSMIQDICRRYPHVKLILAHAGRGFHSPNTRKGVTFLRGIQNVWFDMSGICEASPIMAILQEFGPTRLLWGSDFPISQIIGRSVTLGDGFFWLQPDTCDYENAKNCKSPAIVALESLRALKEAAGYFGLSSEDIQNIFYANAINLLDPPNEKKNKTQTFYEHAKRIIPGGVQLLSKRPEMFAPDLWPAYYKEARGCEIIDLDGRHYYDMSINGVSTCLLGYNDPDVSDAVIRRIRLGSMCTLNSPDEVELADRLCAIHPWAEKVRFARCGGEIGAIAVRIARATTNRSGIAISGYHGWHDWYLAANLGEEDALKGHLLQGLDPLGVPTELRGTAVTFTHGDKKAFDRVMDAYGKDLAAVIMEPCRYHDPEEGYLEYIRQETKKKGILLIFDEITIGWRRNFGGSHLGLGVNPDMAIFAKALGNGHPIAAVIGTKEAMEGANLSFISSTYWTEGIGPAAALATINKLERLDVANRVNRIGEKVMAIWQKYGEKHGLPLSLDSGYPCLAKFSFRHPKTREMETLFTQLMLERGFLAGMLFSTTLAHTEDVLSLYEHAVDDVFQILSQCITEDRIENMLKGPVHHTGFQRLL